MTFLKILSSLNFPYLEYSLQKINYHFPVHNPSPLSVLINEKSREGVNDKFDVAMIGGGLAG